MHILSRGVGFLEIYLSHLKSNKICLQSEWKDKHSRILRRNKSFQKQSESSMKSNKPQKLVVDDAKYTELPEEPTTCCMSGCANCIWLEYAEKLSKIFGDGGDKAIQEINNKVNDPNLKAFLLQELKLKKIN
ncbi:hypothetical protein WA026_010697 [Henosepilachna vigintioctopunctata]|uniref:Oxidoreductase-like domain-containing protein n=1 Tax=Henosepilachna vigintioctopunctata TaxID=420089 RepID=A0AAW1URN4_9CUCU